MSERSEMVAAALDGWRLRDVERDWQDVVSRTMTARSPRMQRLRGLLGRRPYRWRIALAIAAVLVLAVPAIGAVSGAISWPWSHRLGAQLVASVPSVPGTTLRLHSHGALVVRSGGGIRFLSPEPARQRRRFAWQLVTRSQIASAEILLRAGPAVELCSPCTDGESGKFNLSGSRALDVLNGRANLRIRSGDHVTTSPIRLHRLR
jgi:hypothetical protein